MLTIKSIQLEGILGGLDTPLAQRRIAGAATVAGAKSLVESIKESLLRELPKASQQNPKFKDTMVDAIRFSKPYSKTDLDINRRVHALGVYEPKSGTYRTRFYEKLTKPRYQKTYKGKKLKKKRYVGQVGGTMFFSKGYEQGKAEAINRMKDAVKKYLTYING